MHGTDNACEETAEVVSTTSTRNTTETLQETIDTNSDIIYDDHDGSKMIEMAQRNQHYFDESDCNEAEVVNQGRVKTDKYSK